MLGVYVGCLLAGFVYAVIVTVLGTHTEVDVDAGDVGDVGHPDAPGDLGDAGGDIATGHGGPVMLSPFSPIVIASFLTMFGAGGIVGQEWLGLETPQAAMFAVGSGVVVGALVSFVIGKFLIGSQATTLARVQDMVGLAAQVITPIPEGRTGEISYSLAGSRLTSPAKSLDGGAIGRGKVVIIKRVVGSTAYVQPE